MKTFLWLLTLLTVAHATVDAQTTSRKRSPFREVEVQYWNTTDSILLSGTLTMPDGVGKRVPAVLLISGSGQEDRDYTGFGTFKPFKEIAEYLSARGVAVLRVDDRRAGKGMLKGPGYWNPRIKANRHPLFADLVRDVRFGIDYLKTHKEIDSAKVGLLGHSLGGGIAPAAAVQTPVAFVVSVAAPAQMGRELQIRQAFDSMLANGVDSATVEKYVTYVCTPFIDLAFTRPTPEKISAAYPIAVSRVRANMNSLELTKLGMGNMTDPELGSFMLRNLTDEYSLNLLLTTNPALYWPIVRCPVLALFTAKDSQVNASVQAPILQRLLDQSSCPSYQISILSGLNHALRLAKTGSMNENYTLKGGVSDTALRLIYSWLADTLGEKTLSSTSE
jgi:uncharacterized protein